MLKSYAHILLRSPVQSIRYAYDSTVKEPSILHEGLYLASPEFWQELQRKKQGKGKEDGKMELSFLKYWLRSTTRCTPYGTFAGCTIVDISTAPTSIVLRDSDTHRRSLRLDMNYMTDIINALVQMPEVQAQLTFTVNNSLYKTAGAFRYAEYFIENNARSYQLTSVSRSSYLDKILLHAASGTGFKELVNILIQEEQISEEEAMAFVGELLHSQLLIPVLKPAVTGAEPLNQVVERLGMMKGLDLWSDKLKEILTLLQHAEKGVDFYLKIEQKLEQLDLSIKVPRNTVQADLFLNTQSAEINEDIINRIVAQAEDLKGLSRESNNATLEDFKLKFHQRYESASMPLTLVLDADLGIGYAGMSSSNAGAGKWIDDLVIAQGQEADGRRNSDYLQQFSLLKYQEWLSEGLDFIEISEAEINTCKNRAKACQFPNSMFLMGSMMKQNGVLDKEHFVFDVSSFGGPSAANLLGRFSHGDAGIAALTKAILKKEEEEYPDAIYAEIVHLPQARTGNILLRPVLRQYEIPYVGLSGADKAYQITVDDLSVAVRNNEIILWSNRLNKRVIPRLTTAHNFGYNSLPMYKFLCDLQGQGMAYPNAWDWGNLSELKHLPRVVYKNLILRKAVWKVDESQLPDLPGQPGDYSEYFHTFRGKAKMPERVVYKEGDNELLIDFSEERGIDLLLHYIKRYKKIVLEEFLFTEANSIVHDEYGDPYSNELIIPLFEEMGDRTDTTKSLNKRTLFVDQDESFLKQDICRSFSPYSEWLYFKIYCGAKSAEGILTHTILPFAEDGIRLQLFEKFFFVRYEDEGGIHFRIRFFNADIEKQLPLYKQFMLAIQAFIADGTIHRVVLDTYNRELERYEPALMENTETLFYHDSLAVLRFLNLLNGVEDGERYRMLFALRGIDILLSDFMLSIEQKSALLKKLQGSFFLEFGANPALQKQLNDRYRKHQTFFTSHLDASKDLEHEIEEAVEIFSTRSGMNMPVVSFILNQLKESGDADKLFGLLSSYLHMYMNRLFVAQQRKYELVVYHFLERYYSSKIAMAKSGHVNIF